MSLLSAKTKAKAKVAGGKRGEEITKVAEGTETTNSDCVYTAEGKIKGYTAPKQDITRDQYHRWYKDLEDGGFEGDVGGEGLKNAVSNFENSWYVAAALTMTVGFAFLMFQPEGQYPDVSCGMITCDKVATYVFVALSLFGTINSVLGVWWAGHMVS